MEMLGALSPDQRQRAMRARRPALIATAATRRRALGRLRLGAATGKAAATTPRTRSATGARRGETEGTGRQPSGERSADVRADQCAMMIHGKAAG